MRSIVDLIETMSLLFLNTNEISVSPHYVMCLMKSRVNEPNVVEAINLCKHMGDKTYFRGDHSLKDECERFMAKEWYPTERSDCGLFLNMDIDETEMNNKWGGFVDYMIDHDKIYENMDEITERYIKYHDNLEFIREHNEGNHSYKLGVNKFADWSNEEYKEYVKRGSLGGLFKTTCPMSSDQTGSYPTSIDWRQKGIVNAVRDQGQRGTCYAHAVTEAVEGADAQKTGKLQKYSVEALVDCSSLTYGDMGDNGGSIEGSFNFIHDYGTTYDSSYPYGSKAGSCQKYTPLAQITGCYDVPHNELQLTYAVSKRLVAVAIQADSRSFQLYSSGVYDDSKCYTGSLDHAVLTVGYGHDSSSNKDYWIVMNSWSADWGVDGFIYLARNSVSTSTIGTCGIAMDASYPYF